METLMEQLLHYTWKHRLFPLEELKTTDGEPVEVIDVGLHNYDQGPDFFNAKVKISGELWAGNVEIHDRASDWYLHGHDKDELYNNVVLHIVGINDREVQMQSGRYVKQMELQVPEKIQRNFKELIETERYPPCYRIIPNLTKLMIHSWLTKLQTERLEQKTLAILERVKRSCGSWEAACFITMARNYGFGVNGDAFEEWASIIPLDKVAHHRDDLFQIEAIFLGQAGLIERIKDEKKRLKLEREYQYMQHKFSLQPMNPKMWKYLRMRPANFPHVRVLQLAKAYYEHRTELSKLVECETVKDVHKLLNTSDKHLSASSLDILVINTVVPMLFAYGKQMGKEQLQDKAFNFLDELKTENNTIMRTWKECGLSVTTAGDSQALIQLKKEYCDKKKCLYCRIGYEYLKSPENGI